MTASLPTEGVPESEQFGLWRDAISNAFVPLDAQTSVPIAFGGTLVSQISGAVHLCEVAEAAVEVTRSPGAIRPTIPATSCSCRATSRSTIRAALTSCGFDERFRMLVLMFPRELAKSLT